MQNLNKVFKIIFNKRNTFFISFVTLILFFSSPSFSADFIAIYEMARVNDATLAAAKETQLAAVEALPQARANLFPLINANLTREHHNDSLRIFGEYLSHHYTLNLTQPIFNYQYWAQYNQANDIVKQANATYADAELTLIVKTATAYFDVLQAEDNLKFTKAQRAAFAKFLDQTEQRFKVGLIAITDVQIARAKHDSALAQEIAAKTNLENKKQVLQQITGCKVDHLAPLRDNIILPSPDPANVEEWVNAALRCNWSLRAAEYNALAAKDNIKVKASGHYPILNLEGRRDNFSPTQFETFKTETDTVIGLQLQVPIFQGGLVTSETRQAMHQYQKASFDSESQYRLVESNTRQSYLNVLSQLSQVQALKQAIISNQSALDATQAAFNVGTRTIVDVLNSQTDLIQAEQNYATARYTYIVQSLTLKQLAATLSPEDVQHVNCWLKY